MSKVSATTLVERASALEVPVETVRQGACKGWYNVQGIGTISIRDSFNASSVTDIGTGQYYHNFTNPMQNANYNVCSSGSDYHHLGGSLSTTQMTFAGYGVTHGTLTDFSIAYLAAHGDHT